MQEVYEFLKARKTYYLATCEGDQMLAHPKVEICACQDGRWLRVSAEAVLDPRREAKVHMLDQYPHLKARYDPDDENTAVFYLQNATATFSSFTEPPRTVRF